MELKEKVIVITGGSRGFGKALAEGFLKEGAQVVISSRSPEELSKTAQEIGAVGIPADITLENEVTNLAEEVIKKFGHVDVWVNNAGVWLPERKIEDLDMPRVKELFNVNVFGLMNASRVALRVFKKQNGGVILNTISSSALAGRAMISAYSTSKWASNGFTKALREESRENNISVLSIFPGGMKTALFDEEPPENINDFLDPYDVAAKVIANLKLEKPEEELVIKRPTA